MRQPQVGDRIIVTNSGMFDGEEGEIHDITEPTYQVLLDGHQKPVELWPSEFEDIEDTFLGAVYRLGKFGLEIGKAFGIYRLLDWLSARFGGAAKHA